MPQDIDQDKHSLLRKDWRSDIEEGIGTTELERKYRERIRDRVRTGLHDICLLNQYARPEDIKQIFHRKNGGNGADSNQKFAADDRDVMRKSHWVAVNCMVAMAWRGLRANGMESKRIFERVIRPAIIEGEAKHKGVPQGNVEADIPFEKLEVHYDASEMDPVEKVERGLSLSGEEYGELMQRLDEKLDRDFLGEDVRKLVAEHLVEGADD